MATEIVDDPSPPSDLTLRKVDWATYCRLRDEPSNGRLRMSYLDGTLILMSPQYIHDSKSRRIEQVIDMVATALGIPCQGTRTSTLSREQPGPRKGSSKEPDSGFYFGENEPRMRTKEVIDLGVDPPPDLAIEVDHKADSAVALPIYARLGVPEVWRYDVRTKRLWFGRLAGDSCEPIDRSLNLPKLTPALVLQALERADEMGESAWRGWLLDWARGQPEPPATA